MFCSAVLSFETLHKQSGVSICVCIDCILTPSPLQSYWKENKLRQDWKSSSLLSSNLLTTTITQFSVLISL